jgi:uncharacterized protein
MELDVTDNKAMHRFEAEIDGLLAKAEYHVVGDSVVFTYTEVPAQFRGQGVGEELAAAALEMVRERGMHVVAQCKFIAGFIDRHPEYQDLVKS